MAKRIKAAEKKAPEQKEHKWELRLYIAGNTPKSVTASNNLKKYCEEHLKGQYRIEVVDLLVSPQLAAGDKILTISTLVRKVTVPIRKIICDMSNEVKCLVGLNIHPEKSYTEKKSATHGQ